MGVSPAQFLVVIPAEAGIQVFFATVEADACIWAPAFAGATEE